MKENLGECVEENFLTSLYGIYIFLIISGLISCYLSLHRTREALACAGKAIKTIGSNPRTLTVCTM